MKLFNLLKKNHKFSAFNPSNKLEELLLKSALEPAYRAEFYKALIEERLMLFVQNEQLNKPTKNSQRGTMIIPRVLQDGRIPIFSSYERMFDKGIIKDRVQYIQMKGIDLLNMFNNRETLVMNPYSDYGKELLPDEIESIRTGAIFKTGSEFKYQEGAKIILGQPRNYPTKLVNSLKIFCEINKEINAAYLGQIFDPSSSESPHIILGLETAGESQTVFGELGLIVEAYAKKSFVDLVKIGKTSFISDYLVKTKPFFKR